MSSIAIPEESKHIELPNDQLSLDDDKDNLQYNEDKASFNHEKVQEGAKSQKEIESSQFDLKDCKFIEVSLDPNDDSNPKIKMIYDCASSPSSFEDLEVYLNNKVEIEYGANMNAAPLHSLSSVESQKQDNIENFDHKLMNIIVSKDDFMKLFLHSQEKVKIAEDQLEDDDYVLIYSYNSNIISDKDPMWKESDFSFGFKLIPNIENDSIRGVLIPLKKKLKKYQELK